MYVPSPGQLSKDTAPGSRFETRVKFIRSAGMIVTGFFAGAVLGGIAGLFVYANSRTPSAHDIVFAVIQVAGVLVGLFMGYIAARGADVQDQMLDASHRAGLAMLKKYRPKPGAAGHSTVGERVIGPAHKVGEDFLKTLVTKNNGSTDPTSLPKN
jgi:hypothetical protein